MKPGLESGVTVLSEDSLALASVSAAQEDSYVRDANIQHVSSYVSWDAQSDISDGDTKRRDSNFDDPLSYSTFDYNLHYSSRYGSNFDPLLHHRCSDTFKQVLNEFNYDSGPIVVKPPTIFIHPIGKRFSKDDLFKDNDTIQEESIESVVTIQNGFHDDDEPDEESKPEPLIPEKPKPKNQWSSLRRKVHELYPVKKEKSQMQLWALYKSQVKFMSDQEKNRVDLYQRYGFRPDWRPPRLPEINPMAMRDNVNTNLRAARACRSAALAPRRGLITPLPPSGRMSSFN